jgi:uncharacterized protein (UPF0276 family)
MMVQKPATAGIGLRLPHIVEVVATPPAVEWLEIHPENILANPHAMELLIELAEHYPISIHTVGISLGSVHSIDRAGFPATSPGPHTGRSISTTFFQSRLTKTH